VTHWQSPSFFAYFAANSSFPAMLAEMLMTSLNMIGFSWVASPVATELEMVRTLAGWHHPVHVVHALLAISPGRKPAAPVAGLAARRTGECKA
jgi:hypothetical protein